MAYARCLYGWNPPRELTRLQQEFNDLFDGRRWTGDRWLGPGQYPPMNLIAGDDELVVSVELPGVDMADVDISVTENTLTLKAERKPEVEETTPYHRRERHLGPFARSVALLEQVDPGKAEAKYQYGVLTIRLPKAEEVKPRRIAITGS